jgi:hypothetical protein
MFGLLLVEAFLLYRRRGTYVRFRTWIVLPQRLARMVCVLFIYAHPTYTRGLVDAVRASDLRGFFYATTFPVIVAAQNALNFPLLWRHQLPVVLLKTALDLGATVPRIHCALQHASAAVEGISRSACDATLGAIRHLAMASVLLPPLGPGGHGCSGGGAGTAFVAFITLLGCALSLGGSWLYERWLLVGYLRRLGHDPSGLQPGAGAVACWAVAWLALCYVGAEALEQLYTGAFSPQVCAAYL